MCNLHGNEGNVNNNFDNLTETGKPAENIGAEAAAKYRTWVLPCIKSRILKSPKELTIY